MKSKIEWTDKTWNPITGCTKYSSGCVNCYAEMMTRRLKAMGIKYIELRKYIGTSHTTDGIHYNSDGYKYIHSKIKSCIG